MSDSPVVTPATLPRTSHSHGTRFAGEGARLGALLGSRQLGAQYQVVPPGKAAYPCHTHHINEELFVILSGSGTWRRGDERWPIRAGDLVAAPAGIGAAHAHQIVNTGAEPLVYLSISTRHPTDVVEYPDSGKFAVTSGIPEGQGGLSAAFRRIAPDDSHLDYWAGED